MKKFSIAIFGLMLLSCADNQKKGVKVDALIMDSLKIKQTILIEKWKRGIVNDWVIKKSFDSDTIVLTILDSSINKTLDIVTFNNNGSIDYWQFNQKPRCGNGLYYLDSISNWQYEFENKKIILNLSGGIIGYSKFKTKIAYNIDTSNFDKLILVKSKVFYNIAREPLTYKIIKQIQN